MAWLAARPARSALHQQLLRLGPGLGATLLTCLGRIGRRRLGARARIRPRPLLQPSDPILQASDLALIARRQLKQELDARLTTSVVDGLRLSALHTPRVRRHSAQPSPTSTTAPAPPRGRGLNGYGFWAWLGQAAGSNSGSNLRKDSQLSESQPT